MPQKSKPINDQSRLEALIKLIEDPDEQIFNVVAKELVLLGSNSIIALENRLEITKIEDEKLRIENLIDLILANELIKDFKAWRKSEQSLLEGLYLIAKIRNPTLDLNFLLSEYRKIKQNIWLELHSFQTPLEKINSFVVIIYNYYKMQGKELHHFNEKHFYLDHLINEKRGNAYLLGALILATAQDLDIPLFPLLLPHQFLLAYFKQIEGFMPELSPNEDKIAFYFEPTHAHIFSQIDINNYLKKIGENYNKDFFRPLTNDSFIAIILQELSVCLDNSGIYAEAENIRNIIDAVFGDLKDPEL